MFYSAFCVPMAPSLQSGFDVNVFKLGLTWKRLFLQNKTKQKQAISTALTAGITECLFFLLIVHLFTCLFTCCLQEHECFHLPRHKCLLLHTLVIITCPTDSWLTYLFFLCFLKFMLLCVLHVLAPCTWRATQSRDLQTEIHIDLQHYWEALTHLLRPIAPNGPSTTLLHQHGFGQSFLPFSFNLHF